MKGVFVRPDEMRDQVFVRRAVVQDLNVRGRLDEDFRMGG